MFTISGRRVVHRLDYHTEFGTGGSDKSGYKLRGLLLMYSNSLSLPVLALSH